MLDIIMAKVMHLMWLSEEVDRVGFGDKDVINLDLDSTEVDK